MEVTETLNEGLKREFKIVVPAATLEQNLSDKLAEFARTANIPGFRPGKVPVSHLKKVHGKGAMAEVIQDAIEKSTSQAVQDAKLKPAYQPEIELTEDQSEINDIIDGKADLSYKVSFEIVPDIDIKDFSKLKIERHVVKVEDADVDDALNNLQSQYKDFDAEDKGGKAKDGDQVTISFVGRVDGQEFEGGSANDVPLVLGSNSFIPGFEEQLVGKAKGDETVVKVSFPEDYQVEKLAGKPAEFSVTVSQVASPKDMAIDDDFAKMLGLDSLDKLRETVSDRIAEEYGEMTNAKLKRDVLDFLDNEYKFELPAKLVDGEFDQIWKSLEQQMEQEKRSFADEDTTEEEARKEYRAIAERRVRLGLVLGTIGEDAKVVINEQELEQALMDRARQFPGQEQQVFEFYKKTPEAMMELRGPIFEQKVVDHIVGSADLPEKTLSRDDMIALLEGEEEDAGKAKKKAAKKPAKKTAKKAVKKTGKKTGK
jgi:trigger factor